MLCYFAPMEGLTGSIFRKIHHEMFPGVDTYFTPFLSPTQNHKFTARDLREVLPEENDSAHTVPQLLCKSAEDFLWATEELRAFGFTEVNLNAGCPSGTVITKGKGSGLLGDLPRYEAFLQGIFEKVQMPVSIKTRIGLKDAESWEQLCELYNRFPISELTIHPRTRVEYYSGAIHKDAFSYAYDTLQMPLCYNGELRTVNDLHALESRYPNLHAAMIGRGLIANPALVREYRGGKPLEKEELRVFHDALFEAFTAKFGAGVAMFRMRELWVCFRMAFADCENMAIKLSHSKTADDLLFWANRIFEECSLIR